MTEQNKILNGDLPAFASESQGSDLGSGLTKREFFTALALCGILASNKEISLRSATNDAVKAADLTLDVLEKPLTP